MTVKPNGMSLRKLQSHTDSRGELTEIFRAEWSDLAEPVQWNFVRSQPNTLRGMHVHIHHTDHLLVLNGSMQLATCDMREESEAFLASCFTMLSGDELTLVTVPPGIAHTFYFPEQTDLLYSVSSYWDPINDELGCMWNDPALNLNWQIDKPELSPRDQAAQSLEVLLAVLRRREWTQ